MQGDEWDAYVVRETFSAERNAGLPTGREPYSDGVLVVVDGVTPVQGARESRVQGEGGQGTRRTHQGRHARGGAPKPFWASFESVAYRRKTLVTCRACHEARHRERPGQRHVPL
jgi:ribosomal protein L44E